MSMSLYEIDAAIEALMHIDPETGEVAFDEAEFDRLDMERQHKLEQLGLWAKDLKAEITALRAEKMAFAAREKTAENKLRWVYSVLADHCENGKLKTARVSISIKPGNKLVTPTRVADIALLPEQYTKIKTDIVPDRDAIGEALRAGEMVPGCYLEATVTVR